VTVAEMAVPLELTTMIVCPGGFVVIATTVDPTVVDKPGVRVSVVSPTVTILSTAPVGAGVGLPSVGAPGTGGAEVG
jgi:hypothetical protein